VARRRSLRGVKITGQWWTKRRGRPDGKKCEIRAPNIRRGFRAVGIRDVKTCVTDICNSHWFDKATMRFFKSRVDDTAWADGKGGAYFVSSEKGPHGPRAYSVRHYDPRSCSIDTVGEFMGHRTKRQAVAAAKKAAGQR
jgi:hypothetical protein